MKISEVLSEYAIQEERRKEQLNKSIVEMRSVFRKLCIKSSDYYDLVTDVSGDYHALKLSSNPPIIAELHELKNTGCVIHSCHPMFYNKRICVALKFNNLQKLCALASHLDAWLDTEKKCFLVIEDHVMFFFQYFPKKLQTLRH